MKSGCCEDANIKESVHRRISTHSVSFCMKVLVIRLFQLFTYKWLRFRGVATKHTETIAYYNAIPSRHYADIGRHFASVIFEWNAVRCTPLILVFFDWRCIHSDRLGLLDVFQDIVDAELSVGVSAVFNT